MYIHKNEHQLRKVPTIVLFIGRSLEAWEVLTNLSVFASGSFTSKYSGNVICDWNFGILHFGPDFLRD